MNLTSKSQWQTRALRRFAMFHRFNWTASATIVGKNVNLPVLSGMIGMPSEPWMLALLEKLLFSTDGAFVDVGVNLGQTLSKVKSIDSERRYIGFEPNPSCVHYVEELIAANDWTDCRIVPAGLGTVTGLATLELYHGRTADSAASIVDNFRPEEVTFRKTVTLLSATSLPAELLAPRIGIVKVDVEGAEADVVEALHSVIARDRPVVSMEILPCYDESRIDRIERQASVERVFSDLDYRFFRVLHEGRRGSFAIEPIESIGIHGDLAQCEYVICPKESSLWG